MADRTTRVGISNGEWTVNGSPVLEGRTFRGISVQGRLLNARLVQATFDDLNPDTRSLWDYPDGPWDPDRNTAEFLAAMPDWAACGLHAFTINLQGGSPQGYSQHQPWHNSAFREDGSLHNGYLERAAKVIDEADRLGMVVILGLFYFGQDQRLRDEAAVLDGVDQAVDWVCAQGWTNVVIEIANEVDLSLYDHAVIEAGRCHELVERARERSGGRLLVSASTRGDGIPPDSLIGAVDFVLLHGNSVDDPRRIEEMVEIVRSSASYRGQPIDFNEDDHFDFDLPDNNFVAALGAGAGWGFFDYRMAGEGFDEGYQSVPVNWGISSRRKKGFFDLVRSIAFG